MSLRKQLYTGLLCTLSYLTCAQTTGSLHGRITSDLGETLPGVTVMVAGTQKGANTDGTGHYRLENLAPGTYTLAISFVGYQTQQKTVTVKAEETHAHHFKLVSSTQPVNRLLVAVISLSLYVK